MIRTFNKNKDFNPAQLAEEVDALDLGEHTVWFPGFEAAANDRLTPADLVRPRMVVNQDRIKEEARKGDVRYFMKVELTERQRADLEGVLDAHDAKTDSPRQVAEKAKDQDITDLQAAIAAGVDAGDLDLIARLLLKVALR